MKTKNQIRNNRISILFSLTAILLFPFISNAQLKVISTGYVGIGTTSPPIINLDVNGGAAISNTRFVQSGGINYIQSGSNRSVNSWAPLYFGSWGTTGGIKMMIDGAGNVGIGTTSPTAKTHIVTGDDINPSTVTAWDARHFVVGQSGNTGGISLSYNNTNGYGIINALSPNILWRNLVLQSGGGNVGIGTTTPGAYKLYVNGNLNVNGSYYKNGALFTSDQQFKTNIDTIKNALGIIKQLNPKIFYFDTANVYGLNFSNKRQYGLIAQQVATVLPELVTDVKKPADLDTAGNVVHQAITYKALNYNAFIAILMKGIQEQQIIISGLTSKTTKQDSINAALQDQLNNLANTINACYNADNKGEGNSKSLSDGLSQTNVELNNSQTIVLEQNVPNPFAEQTTINYFLPDNTSKAQMLFYDAKGMLIQSVDLIQKGKGALNVFAQDLTNGIYTYTLVVDGKIIETKKMVKQ